MKKKNSIKNGQTLTVEFFEEAIRGLKKEINDHQDRIHLKMIEKIDENSRKHRDQILTRMDKDTQKLEKEREEYLFIKHDIKDLEKRITKLETS